MSQPKRIEPGPGQESVWDYPRPPRLERVADPIRVIFGGETVVETRNAYRVLETSHPPTYYLPPEDIRTNVLLPIRRTSFCEWKGQASYYDVVVGEKRAVAAAWSYPHPTAMFAAIRDHVAIYAHAMDACFVGDEQVQPQAGSFYGGWVTGKIVGPFKGPDGTMGW